MRTSAADPQASTATLRSGALAKLTAVSTDTLRFYERRGLLARPPRDRSGYRRYPREAVDRVRLVQRALDAGFTIEELARILKQRTAGGVPCREVFQIATGRLRELEERIAALTELRDELHRTLGDWSRRLAATPEGQRASLLAEGLDGLRGMRRGKHQLSMRRTVR
jgi:MerR family transcriptional regulator, mercuric resistance operon regulatory protein